MNPTILALAMWIAGAASGPPPTGDPDRAWTFLIYGACDNNAEEDGNFFSFLDGVRGALADDSGIDVVLFIDRSDKYSTNARTLGEDFTDARLYHVRAAGCTRLAGGEAFPEITLESAYEPDSSDPENVRKFVAFGKARFPARHTALMLYGHADGRAMCPDEQSRHEMGFAQLTRVATEKEAVDLMALELCTMAGVEIAYQWR
ncbi:MAG TPA: clostripain-related cysteine peptidase, partial [Planctomycetota bacterium]|nr:clostripain-related cysteine peptidase [Planctomycetota bacterium]